VGDPLALLERNVRADGQDTRGHPELQITFLRREREGLRHDRPVDSRRSHIVSTNPRVKFMPTAAPPEYF
jgi:hypothetical protein